MALSGDDIEKMKVADLKTELTNRGLDSKGLKKDLVERLKAAIFGENGTVTPNNGGQNNGEGAVKPETEVPEEDESMTEEQDQAKEEETHETKVEDPNMSASEAKEPSADDSTTAVYGGKDETMAELDETVKQEPETAEAKEEKSVEGEATVKEEKADVKTDDERGVKRKLEDQPIVFQETPLEEPEIDNDAVTLDWYNSDLHLVIDKESLSKASPISTSGFGYMWAGARCTYGVAKGKIVFQVKITKENDVKHLGAEVNPHVVRVGFSAMDSTMQLGEEPLSYGYGGTGKKSVDLKFSNYGTTFGLNDVITAYLDISEEGAKISYAKNDKDLGEAFAITSEELGNRALFPHVLTKNCDFECNFGQMETPWFPIQEGYTFIGKLPVEERVQGPQPPPSRKECEIIMLCGLPGSGKTTWASNYAAENKDKNYNILGTNSMLDKMKVAGLTRKKNYAGRWDQLIQRCTECLNRLLVIGAKRRRNYILDQTNVYPSAQRRKLKCFGEFIRRAVVIVPTDEEFKKRVAKREAEEGKDVPNEAVLEMKANFRLPPEEGDLLNIVEYVELNKEEAEALVKTYNEEGVKAGYGQKKQPQEKKKKPDDRDKRRRGTRGRGRDARSRDLSRGRFEDRRGPRRSFEPPRGPMGYRDRMPSAPGGRFAPYPPMMARAAAFPRGGVYPERAFDDGYYGGAPDYRRDVAPVRDFYDDGFGEPAYSPRGGPMDRPRGGGPMFQTRGRGPASAGGDRRPVPAARRSFGSPAAGASQAGRGREAVAPRKSWGQPAAQSSSWASPQQVPPVANSPQQWGQSWNQYSAPSTAYPQYQQSAWNGQNYDSGSSWPQQQQSYGGFGGAGATRGYWK
ncbi:heterogeneous nuclear ribonucleoprotein U-like protein 1 isoform X2 [Artemia franciscana]|uniref:Uncharacterized protein n=1 Tax=Artemia franciscana TaxID=6661 RepID=A0AA88HLW9_ARTSF|nr:hypothetical protein QYM36_012855 [Artemia franciscana]KAK2711860.1 hypothetical protein QYM36_012855 [Artemia franciscana]